MLIAAATAMKSFPKLYNPDSEAIENDFKKLIEPAQPISSNIRDSNKNADILKNKLLKNFMDFQKGLKQIQTTFEERDRREPGWGRKNAVCYPTDLEIASGY